MWSFNKVNKNEVNSEPSIATFSLLIILNENFQKVMWHYFTLIVLNKCALLVLRCL